MAQYTKLLASIELNPDIDKIIIDKAKGLADQYSAELYLIHAVEHLSSYGAAYGIAAGADIEEMLLENATETMKKLGKEFSIPENHQLVKSGPAKFIILEEAENLGIDLIVIGSHGRHGIRLILGSTANAVLHSAQCDVLAVRLKD